MLDSAIIYTLYQIKILQNSLGSIWTPGLALAEIKLTLGTYRLICLETTNGFKNGYLQGDRALRALQLVCISNINRMVNSF